MPFDPARFIKGQFYKIKPNNSAYLYKKVIWDSDEEVTILATMNSGDIFMLVDCALIQEWAPESDKDNRFVIFKVIFGDVVGFLYWHRDDVFYAELVNTESETSHDQR